jgi:hypothetical protein
MAPSSSRKSSTNNSANVGFEQKLWLAATATSALRNPHSAIPAAFRRDLHPDLRGNFVLANSILNVNLVDNFT